MEMPPYRLPVRRIGAARGVDAGRRTFLRKVARIILVATVVLWLLLNLPGPRRAETAGLDTGRRRARVYVIDHSCAASIGQAVEPVFAPLGFDWRIDVGLIGALAAREVFVATLGQVAAAQNPDDPRERARPS